MGIYNIIYIQLRRYFYVIGININIKYIILLLIILYITTFLIYACGKILETLKSS